MQTSVECKGIHTDSQGRTRLCSVPAITYRKVWTYTDATKQSVVDKDLPLCAFCADEWDDAMHFTPNAEQVS